MGSISYWQEFDRIYPRFTFSKCNLLGRQNGCEIGTFLPSELPALHEMLGYLENMLLTVLRGNNFATQRQSVVRKCSQQQLTEDTSFYQRQKASKKDTNRAYSFDSKEKIEYVTLPQSSQRWDYEEMLTCLYLLITTNVQLKQVEVS